METAPQVLVNAFPVNPAYLFVRFVLASYPDTPDAVSALEYVPSATPRCTVDSELPPIAIAYSWFATEFIPMAVAYVAEAVLCGPNAVADAPVALLVLPNATPLSELATES